MKSTLNYVYTCWGISVTTMTSTISSVLRRSLVFCPRSL